MLTCNPKSRLTLTLVVVATLRAHPRFWSRDWVRHLTTLGRGNQVSLLVNFTRLKTLPVTVRVRVKLGSCLVKWRLYLCDFLISSSCLCAPFAEIGYMWQWCECVRARKVEFILFLHRTQRRNKNRTKKKSISLVLNIPFKPGRVGVFFASVNN